MAPALTKEQQDHLDQIKKRLAKEIAEENNKCDLMLFNLIRVQNTGDYNETDTANAITTILIPSQDVVKQNPLLKELNDNNLCRCSIFSTKNIEKLSEFKALTTEHLNLITSNNDNLSEQFCKIIINRLFTDNITNGNIKDPIAGGIQDVYPENLKKILDKANLNPEELKKIVSKLFGKQELDPNNNKQHYSFSICNDIVENASFNANVADAIITKINQLNDPTLDKQKETLLKNTLEKLLNNSDNDLPSLVKKLSETKDINIKNQDVILNTIINNKKLSPELAEVLLNKYASSIKKEHLEKIIGVMGNNPNIIKIIFSEPNTKKFIGELNDKEYIQLIGKAETATDLNTILTAKKQSRDAGSDTPADNISNDAADALVSKICEVYNKTIPTPPDANKSTFFEPFVKRPIRAIRDALPPTTDRKQCKELLGQITTNQSLLEKLPRENVEDLMKIAPTAKILNVLNKLLDTAKPRGATSSMKSVQAMEPDSKPQENIKPTRVPIETMTDEQLDGTNEDQEKVDGKQQRLLTTETKERLETAVTGFKATASLDPDAPKVSGGQQLDYKKFIANIGANYNGEENSADNTFKIYKQDDAEKQNTLMEKKADGSLVFRKEFSEEDAKLFLKSIESLAEAAKANPTDKLQLEMANFTETQLDCIRTLVAQPDQSGTTTYKELLSRVEFLSADGQKVDLSLKPPQANPQLVAKPQNADLPPRPQSAPVGRQPR